MNNPFEIILNILKIINYEDDAHEFAENFIYVCNMKAIVELLQLLPEKEKAAIHTLLNESENEQIVLEKLQELIHPDEFAETLSATSAQLFDEYIQHIFPTLNITQKEHLEKYLASIAS